MPKSKQNITFLQKTHIFSHLEGFCVFSSNLILGMIFDTFWCFFYVNKEISKLISTQKRMRWSYALKESHISFKFPLYFFCDSYALLNLYYFYNDPISLWIKK
jgi:hypothetical protein